MSQRYKNITLQKNEDGRVYQVPVIYPEIPPTEDDIYMITTFGDRYDLLAKSFYGDVRLWWIIACANSSTTDSLFIEPGVQIRVPVDKSAVLNQFEELNRTR